MKRSLLIISYVNIRDEKIYPIFSDSTELRKAFSELYDVSILCQPMPGEYELEPFFINHEGRVCFDYFKTSLTLRLLAFIFNKIPTNSSKTSVVLKLRDLVSAFICTRNSSFNVVVNVESINFLGTWMNRRKNKNFQKLIYFCNDYHPNRYRFLFTTLYNWLDKFSSYRADYNWLMNLDIQKHREKLGFNSKMISNVQDISGGIIMPFFKEKKRKFGSLIKIVYAARNWDYGLDLALDACVLVSKEIDIKIQLTITGGDIKKYILDKYCNIPNLEVKNDGFLPLQELDELLYDSHIGLALYPQESLSSSSFGDPEKVRRYINAGLPSVVSGPGRTVERAVICGSAIRTDNEAVSIKNNILILIKSESYYAKLEKASFRECLLNREKNKIRKCLNEIFNENFLKGKF